MLVEKEYLIRKYLKEKKSARSIAEGLGCSENKIHYWLDKFQIPKRSISDAVYIKNNPLSDPFHFGAPKSSEEWFLYGLGLGLYWGEGNKMNKYAVRLGNTDPDLVRKFLEFLTQIFKIDHSRLRFGLQVFSDVSSDEALAFWLQSLSLKRTQFQKVIITKSRMPGTYRKKNKYGVLTVYFSNTKLRDTIVAAIDQLRKKPS